jgi:hypothetical protein
MESFIVYVVLLFLYLISFYLEIKMDQTKKRLVFVQIWSLFVLVIVLYPLFAFPGWWKLLILFSIFFICITTLFEDKIKSNGASKSE